MPDSLWPHGLQHARLPCPSPSPGVYPSSCPLHWWCHPTISTSVTTFFFCLQSFSASGSFPMSPLFTSGGQSIGALVSASVLPMNIQGWFPLGFTGLITLQSKGLSIIFSSTTIWKHKFFGTQTSLVAQMVKHLPMTQETWVRSLGWEDLLEKEMATHSSILAWKIPWKEEPGRLQSMGSQRVGHNWATFTFYFKLVIAFLPRRKRFLISWLQSVSTVILEPKKIKSVTVSIVSPSVCHEVMGLDAMILVFWMLSFKPTF